MSNPPKARRAPYDHNRVPQGYQIVCTTAPCVNSSFMSAKHWATHQETAHGRVWKCVNCQIVSKTYILHRSHCRRHDHLSEANGTDFEVVHKKTGVKKWHRTQKDGTRVVNSVVEGRVPAASQAPTGGQGHPPHASLETGGKDTKHTGAEGKQVLENADTQDASNAQKMTGQFPSLLFGQLLENAIRAQAVHSTDAIEGPGRDDNSRNATKLESQATSPLPPTTRLVPLQQPIQQLIQQAIQRSRSHTHGGTPMGATQNDNNVYSDDELTTTQPQLRKAVVAEPKAGSVHTIGHNQHRKLIQLTTTSSSNISPLHEHRKATATGMTQKTRQISVMELSSDPVIKAEEPDDWARSAERKQRRKSMVYPASQKLTPIPQRSVSFAKTKREVIELSDDEDDTPETLQAISRLQTNLKSYTNGRPGTSRLPNKQERPAAHHHQSPTRHIKKPRTEPERRRLSGQFDDLEVEEMEFEVRKKQLAADRARIEMEGKLLEAERAAALLKMQKEKMRRSQ